MNLNYRVMCFRDVSGEPRHQIHEVYYDGEGKPNSYTKNAVSACSADGIDGLKRMLEKMQEALDRPVLQESDFLIKEFAKPGSLKDHISIADDFDAPLDIVEHVKNMSGNFSHSDYDFNRNVIDSKPIVDKDDR